MLINMNLNLNSSDSIQFNSYCPTLTPKVTSDKKLSQCTEGVFKQKRFHCALDNVRVCYFLNCLGQAVPSFRPSMGKTAFAKLQPSCQWFITVSPGRSETDSERYICGSSNEIRSDIRIGIYRSYFLLVTWTWHLNTYTPPGLEQNAEVPIARLRWSQGMNAAFWDTQSDNVARL